MRNETSESPTRQVGSGVRQVAACSTRTCLSLLLVALTAGGCGDKAAGGGQTGAGGVTNTGASRSGGAGGSGGATATGGSGGESAKGGSPGGGTATGGSGGGASGGAAGTGGAAPASGGSIGVPGGPGGGSSGNDGGTDAPVSARRTAVIFLIDGLSPDAARTAAAAGATNLKMVIDNGVTVETAHSTSPAARTTLPNGSLPWGNATSGNIAVHTGTHVYEAGPSGLDDIFQSAKAAGMKTVFSGGDRNYMGLNTADFAYAASVADAIVVTQAINHIKNDKVRVLRLHLQRIRDDWSGPADKTNAMSAYVKHIVASDALLGQLIAALKAEGVWDDTLLIVTADHGMGQSSDSGHPASTRSSWDIFMGFYGAGVKKGAKIPYAELPDVGVTAAKFLGLTLKGHTGAGITLAQKGPTGTVLSNIYEGAPAEIAHPRYVDQYLKMNSFPGTGDMYAAYRAAMLTLIK